MCGIAGIIEPAGKISESVAKRAWKEPRKMIAQLFVHISWISQTPRGDGWRY